MKKRRFVYRQGAVPSLVEHLLFRPTRIAAIPTNFGVARATCLIDEYHSHQKISMDVPEARLKDQ